MTVETVDAIGAQPMTLREIAVDRAEGAAVWFDGLARHVRVAYRHPREAKAGIVRVVGLVRKVEGSAGEAR